MRYSYNKLIQNKEKIKGFIKSKDFKEIVFFDPRRNLNNRYSSNQYDFYSQNLGILARNKDGITAVHYVDFFADQRTKFMDKIYNSLNQLSSFFNHSLNYCNKSNALLHLLHL